ncbi:hypothetical protein EJ08DRAFT_652241 [Tothia fuscella]|uniref:Uncharacterized protein n=1 Tax=Tothia fuscella TaxID=1048955 RepID=A0A9P4TV43_9PEZI|nr:hypothetical protein EJ08DRAFT_652241 [Tothia fuscella]
MGGFHQVNTSCSDMSNCYTYLSNQLIHYVDHTIDNLEDMPSRDSDYNRSLSTWVRDVKRS